MMKEPQADQAGFRPPQPSAANEADPKSHRRSVLLPSTIRLTRAICGDLGQAERREWWLANCLGGYASGTIAGSLTRRYHGLLIAPIASPLGRRLILAKADATVIEGSQSWSLFTNRWKSGAISPAGHIRIGSFELDYSIPVWTYEVGEQPQAAHDLAGSRKWAKAIAKSRRSPRVRILYDRKLTSGWVSRRLRCDTDDTSVFDGDPRSIRGVGRIGRAGRLPALSSLPGQRQAHEIRSMLISETMTCALKLLMLGST